MSDVAEWARVRFRNGGMLYRGGGGEGGFRTDVSFHAAALSLPRIVQVKQLLFFFFFLFNSRIAPCGKYFSLRSSSVTFIFLHSLNDNTALSLKEEENEKKKELRYTIAASCDDTRTKTEIKRERVGVGRGTR